MGTCRGRDILPPMSPLAYAEAQDMSGSGLTFVVITACLVVLFGLMALVPWRTARVRRPQQSQNISSLTTLWMLLAIGITSYTILAQMNWKQAHLTDLMSGYADPRDISDQPTLLWFWLGWSVLAPMYAGLVYWARSRPRGPTPPLAPRPPSQA